VIALAVRATYTRKLLPDTRYRTFTLPVVLPLAAATAATLALRLLLWGGHRPLTQAIGELALFAVVYALVVLRRERPLIDELLGAVRGNSVEVGVSAVPR
jgi:hypothetical protein